MKQFCTALFAILIGFLLLGPIGAVLSFLIWYTITSNGTLRSPKK